jgi:aminoglycoside 6'-N-acetyltransferase I
MQSRPVPKTVRRAERANPRRSAARARAGSPAPATGQADETLRQERPVQLEIRRVRPGDDALFDRVAAGVFDEPVYPGRLTAYLAEPGHHMLVAIHAGEVVAQVAAVVHRHPDKSSEFYIDEVGVAPALQRRGIARRMLDEMLALGRTLGCAEAWVGTEPGNRAARGLYETQGAVAEPFVMYVFKL